MLYHNGLLSQNAITKTEKHNFVHLNSGRRRVNISRCILAAVVGRPSKIGRSWRDITIVEILVVLQHINAIAVTKDL